MSEIQELKDELYTRVKEEIQKARHFPSGPSFKNLNKQLADLSIERGNDIEGIYHLTESLGVSMRLLSQHATEERLRKKVVGRSLDRSLLDFNGPHTDVTGMMQRLRELPEAGTFRFKIFHRPTFWSSEWTVVHITLGFDPDEIFRRPGVRSQNLELRVSLLPTGETPELPVVQKVSYAAEREDGMPTPLEELAQLVEDNRTLPKQYYNDKKKYWAVRREIDTSLERVVKGIEFSWLSHWRFLLLGNLSKSDMEKSKKLIDQLLLAHYPSTVTDRSRFVLIRVAVASHLLRRDEVYSLVDELLGTSKQADCVASGMIEKFKWVAAVARQPVVLIVDEVLDVMPWENLSITSDQPMTRVACLAILHALFKVHEGSIKRGYKIVDNKKGSFVVNPQLNLPQMELRFREFLPARLPNWQGTYGKCDVETILCYLQNFEVFLYAGHGSGRDVLARSRLEMAPVCSVAFLMGCSSTRKISMGGCTEYFSIVDHYNSATCPLVVGNLWEVGDTDTDRVTTFIFHNWIPLSTGLSKDITKFVSTIHSNNSALKYKYQPDLLRVIVDARMTAKSTMNRFAMVARGLPVMSKY